MAKKLIIASNRLPYQIKKNKGELQVQKSSGGLVSAISALSSMYEITWIGAADFKEELWREFSDSDLTTEFKLVPLFIEKQLEKLYYNGFSNTLIWPLFHYFPSYSEYDENSFKAYRYVNRLFAHKIKEVAREEDVIWIHDYHLMLVPGFLKNSFESLSCAFFLHIPFPSYELIKLIPEDWRKEILQSLVCSSVIGFQTSEHASHFKNSVAFFLGQECTNNELSINGHISFVKHYPISIDVQKFEEGSKSPEVIAYRDKIRKHYEGVKIIFSLDRLDYTKGVINRLEAFESLLSAETEWLEKVILIINVIPSRETLSKYAERKKLIEENITRINGVYGNIHWQPIIYQYQHLGFTKLVACYAACDIMLVTPLRDGMNLVAKEFIASRRDQTGTLILSEFAGASEEMNSAILVNPNDLAAHRKALRKALESSKREQKKNISTLQEYIREHDVHFWAKTFLDDVETARKRSVWIRPNFMTYYDRNDIFEAYEKATQRLILLDYDGTLMPFQNRPEDAMPDAGLKELIKRLTADKKNKVMLISGRDALTLENWFRKTPIALVAEHGVLHREFAGEWQFPGNLRTAWKEEVRLIMDKFVKTIPDSFIEEKKYGMAWHYRATEGVDEEAVRLAFSKELMMLNNREDFEVMHANKVIEIKSSHAGKGRFIQRYLQEKTYDFVLAIGDDVTDEEMFSALKHSSHYTIKVGLGPTAARYNIVGVKSVHEILEELSATYKKKAWVA